MKVIFPLPLTDFDPSEAAIPWKYLTRKNVQVQFATVSGSVAACDQKMLTGKGLGLLAGILAANTQAVSAYQEMQSSVEFRNPIMWNQIKHHEYSGIVLAGGHAQGMKEYLESEILQKLIVQFFKNEKKIGAICHGVVLAARSYVDGKSILFGRKTTALLKSQELMAWTLTRAWLKNYYRTYPETVEDEVRRHLQKTQDFWPGPTPFLRDSPENPQRGFVVQDGNYLSARWPGDANKFAQVFFEMINT